MEFFAFTLIACKWCTIVATIYKLQTLLQWHFCFFFLSPIVPERGEWGYTAFPAITARHYLLCCAILLDCAAPGWSCTSTRNPYNIYTESLSPWTPPLPAEQKNKAPNFYVVILPLVWDLETYPSPAALLVFQVGKWRIKTETFVIQILATRVHNL